MTATYDCIASTTLTSAAASVTFSSIPGTYTDLVLVSAATITTGTGYLYLRFNGDTGNNYSNTAFRGTGSAVNAAAASADSRLYITYGSPNTTEQNNIITNIQNYSNTTTYKTTVSRDNNTNIEAATSIAMWSNTSAITSILVAINTANIDAGSVISLYGIKAE